MNTGENVIDVSIVIPCYNEESCLQNSFKEISQIISSTRFRCEFIFVDDCSVDSTREIIQKICNENKESCHYLFHQKNMGRGASFKDGAALSKGKFVGFLDIDLEVSAAYIPIVLSKLVDGADIVTIRRHYNLVFSFVFMLRHILSNGYKLLIKYALKLPFQDTETGYKFFTREALLKIINETKNNHWFWDTEIMYFANRQKLIVLELPGLFMRRKDKKSTVRLFHDSVNYIKEVYKFRKRINEK